MKKKISLTSLIMIVCFSIVCLFGCSTNEKAQTENETEKINDSTLGTWQSVKANIENSEFTMEELETMGEADMIDFQLIFKDGGQCVIIEAGDYVETLKWTETESGVNVGETIMDREGKYLTMEYDEAIVYFEKISDSQTVPSEELSKSTEAEKDTTESEKAVDNQMGIDFMTAMDEYEAFFDEYVIFMKEYNSSADQSALIYEYQDYVEQYAETMEAMSSFDTSGLTEEELVYYTEVNARIVEKLAEIETD